MTTYDPSARLVSEETLATALAGVPSAVEAAQAAATQAVSAAETATTMAGQTVALQDAAVKSLIADEYSDTRTELNAAFIRGKSVPDPSGSDDTAALQAAVDAAATFGYPLYWPVGEWTVDGLVYKSGVQWYGAGRDKTVVKLKASATTGRAVVSDGFDDAILSNDPDLGVEYHVQGMTFDGQAASQSSRTTTSLDFSDMYGVVSLYGWGRLHDVEIKNAREIGLYTEFAKDWGNLQQTTNLECKHGDIYVTGYCEAGWVNRGSHDSVIGRALISNFNTIKRPNYGYVQESSSTYSSGAMKADWIHVYGSHEKVAGWIHGSNLICGDLFMEGAQRHFIDEGIYGYGLLLDGANDNFLTVTTMYADYGVGLINGASANTVEIRFNRDVHTALFKVGLASGNRLYLGSQMGGAYNLDGPTENVFDLSSYDANSGRNHFHADFYAFGERSGGDAYTVTMLSGTPAASDSAYLVKRSYLGTVETNIRVPTTNPGGIVKPIVITSGVSGRVNFGDNHLNGIQDITVNSGFNLRTPLGARLGSASTDLLGFWGSTPKTRVNRIGQITDSTGGDATIGASAPISDSATANAIALLIKKWNDLEAQVLSSAGGGYGLTD